MLPMINFDRVAEAPPHAFWLVAGHHGAEGFCTWPPATSRRVVSTEHSAQRGRLLGDPRVNVRYLSPECVRQKLLCEPQCSRPYGARESLLKPWSPSEHRDNAHRVSTCGFTLEYSTYYFTYYSNSTIAC